MLRTGAGRMSVQKGGPTAERRRPGRTLLLVAAALAFAGLYVTGAASQSGDASDRGSITDAVTQTFNALRDRQYGAAYDNLPSVMKENVTRAAFIKQMAKAGDRYQLERVEILNVQSSGNFAVVDTVMYGQVLKPTRASGKLVVQQLLVREGGSWKIASGYLRLLRRLKAEEPQLAKQYRQQTPRLYALDGGRWVEVPIQR